MLVSGTGGGSQDLGPLSGCIRSKESPVPSQQAARITIAPPKKSHLFPVALDVMQLDSLCFGTACPAGCHFSCSHHSRQGDARTLPVHLNYLPPQQLSDAISHTLKASLHFTP